jgi:nitrogen regulatory protein PII
VDEAWGLTRMTKVEVVVGGEDVPVVTELFSEVGASGYTAISNVSGLGHSGYHQGRLLFNDRSVLTILTVVLPAERATALLDGLRSLLANRSGVLLVSDTWVSRPEYFQ